MRKFNFKLQKLLDYRETIEEKLLSELAVIRAEHDRQVGILRQMVETRDSFRRSMTELLAAGDLEDIKEAHRYLNELVRCVQLQEMKVRQVADQKDRKTAEVVEAAKERKILERLRDYKLVEHKHEQQADEQKFLDDLASIRHNRRTAVGNSVAGGQP